MMAVAQIFAPTLVDAAMARLGIASERTTEPQPGGAPGNLFAPRTDDNRAEGDFSTRARRFSLYTWLETHRWARPVVLGGLVAGTTLLLARGRDR